MDENDLKISNTKIFIKNLFLEFLISIFLIFIFSIFLSKTNLDEKTIAPTIIFISSFSILVGSFLSSKKIKKSGFLIGILQGFTYIAILYLISSLCMHDFSINSSALMMILISVFCGVIGGIFGVNMSRS